MRHEKRSREIAKAEGLALFHVEIDWTYAKDKGHHQKGFGQKGVMSVEHANRLRDFMSLLEREAREAAKEQER